MTLMSNGRREKKSTAVWPIVITRYDSCFRLICPSCSIFIVPFFYVLTIHICPRCGRRDVDTRSLGCSAHWALQLRGTKKEEIKEGIRQDEEGVGSQIAFLLKKLYNLDSQYQLAKFCGPYEDEVSALVLVARGMGFFGPRGTA